MISVPVCCAILNNTDENFFAVSFVLSELGSPFNTPTKYEFTTSHSLTGTLNGSA